MSDQSTNIVCNGEMEIVKITADLYDEAIKLFIDNFIQKENICLATKLHSSPEGSQELQSVCRELLKENISFAVRSIDNGELAAIAINHLMSSQEEKATLCDFMNSLKTHEMICINNFLERVEIKSDIYNVLQIDCVMEIVFLSTSARLSKRGLASILTEYSINYARRLKERLLSHEDEQPAENVRSLTPSAVCSLFTSLFTQRIGRKFGFEILVKVPFTDFSFDGKTFAERIDPIHEYATFEALRL
ncbi:uncharacterized protein [Eurosta solidaginis]|uniref:uncharacterized protein n=1 Tax=Eurosta solidaginis TaxID=178769 RepID=UPI0035305D6C